MAQGSRPVGLLKREPRWSSRFSDSLLFQNHVFVERRFPPESIPQFQRVAEWEILGFLERLRRIARLLRLPWLIEDCLHK